MKYLLKGSADHVYFSRKHSLNSNLIFIGLSFDLTSLHESWPDFMTKQPHQISFGKLTEG